MDNPTISDLIIAMLFSGRSVRRYRAILHEKQLQRYKRASVSIALTRLKNKRYVRHNGEGWSLTKTGKLFANRRFLFSYLASPFPRKNIDKVYTIVSFDIPESSRNVRNWLRNQLKIFGYEMLQQSLWIGPGPLPKIFLERLEKLKVRDKVKIFSRAKRLT